MRRIKELGNKNESVSIYEVYKLVKENLDEMRKDDMYFDTWYRVGYEKALEDLIK